MKIKTVRVLILGGFNPGGKSCSVLMEILRVKLESHHSFILFDDSLNITAVTCSHEVKTFRDGLNIILVMLWHHPIFLSVDVYMTHKGILLQFVKIELYMLVTLISVLTDNFAPTDPRN